MIIRNCLWALFISVALISSATAMRCGDKLVAEGDSDYDVLSKCGEPLYKHDYDQAIPQYNSEGYQVGVINSSISKWVYQKSPADFQYQLIFDAGVLKQIITNRNP